MPATPPAARSSGKRKAESAAGHREQQDLRAKTHLHEPQEKRLPCRLLGKLPSSRRPSAECGTVEIGPHRPGLAVARRSRKSADAAHANETASVRSPEWPRGGLSARRRPRAAPHPSRSTRQARLSMPGRPSSYGAHPGESAQAGPDAAEVGTPYVRSNTVTRKQARIAEWVRRSDAGGEARPLNTGCALGVSEQASPAKVMNAPALESGPSRRAPNHDDPDRHQDQDQCLVERCEAAQAGDPPVTPEIVST